MSENVSATVSGHSSDAGCSAASEPVKPPRSVLASLPRSACSTACHPPSGRSPACSRWHRPWRSRRPSSADGHSRSGGRSRARSRGAASPDVIASARRRRPRGMVRRAAGRSLPCWIEGAYPGRATRRGDRRDRVPRSSCRRAVRARRQTADRGARRAESAPSRCWMPRRRSVAWPAGGSCSPAPQARRSGESSGSSGPRPRRATSSHAGCTARAIQRSRCAARRSSSPIWS